MSQNQRVALVTGPTPGIGGAMARRGISDACRRQVVAETWQDTESVSEIARRHALNANLVFKWRLLVKQEK